MVRQVFTSAKGCNDPGWERRLPRDDSSREDYQTSQYFVFWHFCKIFDNFGIEGDIGRMKITIAKWKTGHVPQSKELSNRLKIID
jgi:hypothetical protein